jgi:uncharacterized protein
VSVYFLDTSGIVKRYAIEQGYQWILNLCTPDQHHALYISQAALVEVQASLCRKERMGTISLADRDTSINNFKRDIRRQYKVVRVTNAIYSAGGDLCRKHKLRAYDAIQLACALAVRDNTLANNRPAPIFVRADNDLLSVATAEGLVTENPNNYP